MGTEEDSDEIVCLYIKDCENRVKRSKTSHRPRKKRKIQLSDGQKSDDNKLGYNKKMEFSFTEILYNKTFYEKMQNEHVLQLNPESLSDLIDAILNTPVGGVVLLKSALVPGTKFEIILKEMVQKWKRFKIKYFLERECSIQTSPHISDPPNYFADKCTYSREFIQEALSAVSPPSDRDNEINLIKSEFGDTVVSLKDSPLNKAMNWKNIYRFLLSIVRHVIPLEMFGSVYNRGRFQKTIKTILMLGKYDVISLDHIMFDVKISHCKWAKHLNSFSSKSKFVTKVWLWLLKLMTQVLKSFFYITETNSRSSHLSFFRKRDFQSLHDAGIEDLLKNGHFLKIKPKEMIVLQTNLSNLRNFRPPSLRFIPKASGLRLIHSLKRAGLSSSESTEAKLLLDHMTSTFFQEVNSSSLSHLQSLWIRYLESVADKEDGPLHVVKVDIRDAFGSIKLDVLLSLLKEKSLLLPPMVRFAREYYKKSPTSWGRYRYVIARGPGRRSDLRVDVKETVENIRQVVLGQVAKVNSSSWLLRVKGVAQGAALSSHLCDLYYGAMFKKYLSRFCQNGRFLIRCVDDFLYVSPDPQEARTFLAFMERGIEEFGCSINPQKTSHNLDGTERRISFMRLVLCTKSKQLLLPVGSLSAYPPRYSLRLHKSAHPGRVIATKLALIMNARLPSLVLNPSYTTIPALISNIWRAGISVGGRLVCLIHTLLLPKKHYNSKFLGKTVSQIAGRVWSKVNGLWKHSKQQLLPFSKHFCFVVFIGGIFILMDAKRHPQLPSLRRRFKGIIRFHLKRLTLKERDRLPRPTPKIFDESAVWDKTRSSKLQKVTF